MDRRTRKHDSIEQGKLETIVGTFKFTGHNIHDYTIPNDHYRGVFENICPEDFANYWNFNNKRENTMGYLKLFNLQPQIDKKSDLVQDFESNEILEEGLQETKVGFVSMFNKELRYVFGFLTLAAGTTALL
jgi:hypothetical protein